MNGYKPINNGIPGTPPTCGSGIIDEMTEFEKQYITETGLAFFVAVEKDGSQWIRKEQWDWMLNLFTADRDKLQAEVARHEKDFLTAVAEAEELRGRLEVALGLVKSEKSRADNLKKERDVLEISRNFYYNQWKENETITPWFEKDFQLPESGRLLIVRVLGDDIPEMAYVEKSISEDCFVSCLTGERLKVTHWMYIPEFKEDESCK